MSRASDPDLTSRLDDPFDNEERSRACERETVKTPVGKENVELSSLRKDTGQIELFELNRLRSLCAAER